MLFLRFSYKPLQPSPPLPPHAKKSRSFFGIIRRVRFNLRTVRSSSNLSNFLEFQILGVAANCWENTANRDFGKKITATATITAYSYKKLRQI